MYQHRHQVSQTTTLYLHYTSKYRIRGPRDTRRNPCKKKHGVVRCQLSTSHTTALCFRKTYFESIISYRKMMSPTISVLKYSVRSIAGSGVNVPTVSEKRVSTTQMAELTATTVVAGVFTIFLQHVKRLWCRYCSLLCCFSAETYYCVILCKVQSGTQNRDDF